VGDYWDVWPAVFHANWVRFERREPGQLWGITGRSGATERLWRPALDASARVCAPVGFEDLERRVAKHRLGPLTPIGRAGALDVFSPAGGD
jgi:hypothetical protein